MIATTQMRRLMEDTMTTSMERLASTTTAPRATNTARMETIMITSTTTITRNTSMEKVASIITALRATNTVRMDTIMITSTTKITRNTSMERVASMTTVPRATNTVIMDTSMVNPMIIRMTINMASLHLQSCLSKRGRGRRKRNLARH
jgi:hypothetical protein